MAKKKLKSGFHLPGIAPNLLLKDVENTAPFLFNGEITSDTEQTRYFDKLRFYKKNLKQLNNINLTEYFHICLAAHWSTAGTFVPTDVDNQIRQNLWNHDSIKKHIEKMTLLTIESWKWDYTQVTNRISRDSSGKQVMSTHEGTWLSVAIGAYCALKVNKMDNLRKQIEDVILAEIKKEQEILLEMREKQDHINFLSCAPLMAHNLGDLDRVMVAWNMHETDNFCKSIYKLGHELNPSYSPILVYTGQVNKQFTANENHRHMALRKPKCLRKSNDFLVSVAPFMDDWGSKIGSSSKLTLEDKAEIIAALFEGYKREQEAYGYARAYGALIAELPLGIKSFEQYLSFDIIKDIQDSKFQITANLSLEEFESTYIKQLTKFVCQRTNLVF